jgi:hypothetical protein
VTTAQVVFVTIMFVFGVGGMILAATALRAWERERRKIVTWKDLFK